MNFKAFSDDTEAVSPVIGVILMVAITVILAAVIGTFVLGLGDQVQTTAPSANFDSSQGTEQYVNGSDQYDFDTFTVEITGGQTLDAETIEVRVNGNAALVDDGSGNPTVPWESGELSAGSNAPIVAYNDTSTGAPAAKFNAAMTDDGTFGNGDYHALEEGDTVTVVWSDEGQSQTLFESTVE